MRNQLLCTFSTEQDLENTLDKIENTYSIIFNSIYILRDVNDPNVFFCTYNIDIDADIRGEAPSNTISLHRKKSTNTLYTINALNLLIAKLNNGIIDKNFKINWNEYKNTIMVTAHTDLKIIHTQLDKIIEI